MKNNNFENNLVYQKIIKNIKNIINNSELIYINKINKNHYYLLKCNKTDEYFKNTYNNFHLNEQKIIEGLIINSSKLLKTNLNIKNFENLKEKSLFWNCEILIKIKDDKPTLEYVNGLLIDLFTFDEETLWMRDLKEEISSPVISLECLNDSKCNELYDKLEKDSIKLFHSLNKRKVIEKIYNKIN